MIELSDITYRGPEISDPDILAGLPDDLASLIRDTNGIVAFRGGLHIRGACNAPVWHSLRHAWKSEKAFFKSYRDLRPSDIPFAEDCLGDQFVIREGEVHHLVAETGELQNLAVGLFGFLTQANSDRVEYLSLQPLLRVEHDGVALKPGELLHAYPPFCTVESASGQVSLRPVPSHEVHAVHAQLATFLRDNPDITKFEMRVDGPPANST